MLKLCPRTFPTLMYRCVERKMTKEMSGAPRQRHGWRMHISRTFELLASLRGDAGKLMLISNSIPENEVVISKMKSVSNSQLIKFLFLPSGLMAL